MARSVADTQPGKAVPADAQHFEPYGPATQSPAEFTLKAIVIGALFGLLFGASTVYPGLRAWFHGDTALASIAGGALFLGLAAVTAHMAKRRVV